MITATTVAEAGAVIGPWLRRTPVLAVDLPTGDNVVLKLENLQHAGSFKPRGAFWSVLSQAKRPLGLVAASQRKQVPLVARAASNTLARAACSNPIVGRGLRLLFEHARAA